MRVSRSGERIRLRLNVAESHLLEQLFEGLQDLVGGDELDPSDPVRRRLYPAGYEDAEQAAAFRDLTESALRQDRSERIDECLAEVRGGRSLIRTEVVIGGDAVERWLRVLNDLRLSLGTRLGITQDDDNDLDDSDPQIGMKVRYRWLTALQDALVTTAMG